MPADKDSAPEKDDLKAKMREALERKQRRNDPSSDDSAVQKGHDRGHAEAHGPAAVKREHRRKAGGGGA